jgi:ABC-2 type transport system ATP-binding protein
LTRAGWCADSALCGAVDGIDLAVARGTIFALLGPNGAGATTLLRTLSTLLRPTQAGPR